MINLGDLVRDEVTGFEGVVLARQEALYEAFFFLKKKNKISKTMR